MQFYIKFGNRALWGVLLSTILFSYLGALVLYLSCKLRSSGYDKLFYYVLGNRLYKVMDITSIAMLAGGLGIMLAGSGAVFYEHLGLSKYLGALLAAVVTCLAIWGGLQGILTINAWLVPIKVVVIIFVCAWALSHAGTTPQAGPEIAQDKVAGNWFWSAILYVSYNMIIPVAVLSSLGQTVNKKMGITSGIIGGLVLGGTATVITMAGLVFYPLISQYQVPMLFLAQQVSSGWQKILALLIWLAILTTAVANAHGFASRFAAPNSKKYKIIGLGLVIAIFPFAAVEFTQLIKSLYPLFGYAGLILLGALLFTPLVRHIYFK